MSAFDPPLRCGGMASGVGRAFHLFPVVRGQLLYGKTSRKIGVATSIKSAHFLLWKGINETDGDR